MIDNNFSIASIIRTAINRNGELHLSKECATQLLIIAERDEEIIKETVLLSEAMKSMIASLNSELQEYAKVKVL